MTGSGQRLMPQQTTNGNGHLPPALRPTALSTRTRPKAYAALAVALIIGFGALGYYFYSTAGAKVGVVVAVRDIPVGHTIERSDLGTTAVSGGVTAVAADNLATLVGQHAAVEILPNTLVQRAMVTSGSTVQSGQSLVGVATAPGQIPSSGLAPGDKVQVLQLPQKGASPSPGNAGSAASSSSASKSVATNAVLVAAATVFDVRPDSSTSGGTLLTLIVPAADAYGVAQASNDNLIALVKIGG